MANANVAAGLRPITREGAIYAGVGTLCAVPASQASNIFLGDPLVALGGSDAFGCPLVGLASAGAGQPILGSMNGVSNGPAAGGNAVSTVLQNSTVYRQGGVLNYILAAIDPAQLYVVQEDSVGGSISAAVASFAVGNLSAGAGNTTTAFSGFQLQSSSVTASANPTYQLKIIGLLRGPGNSIGSFADWVVRLNNSQYSSNSGV